MMEDFEYLQQRLRLHVELMERHLTGVSELILAPKQDNIKQIRVHCRQCVVSRVTVNGVEARFEHHDFLGEIVQESYRDWSSFDLFYRGAIVASKEGTLVIEMPPSVRIVDKKECKDDDSKKVDGENPTDDEHDANAVWDSSDVLPLSSTKFAPVRVRIQYTVTNPRGGVRFMLPDELHPNRVPHMYTYCGPFGGLCDGARTWMPCRDMLGDKCTFRIELIVPASCVAVCSGRLVGQTLDAQKLHRTFRFVVDTKTSCSLLGFAVGPFRMHVSESMPRVAHFCLPDRLTELMTATKFKDPHFVTYFETYFNARYPFATYSQIFVDDPPTDCQYFAGLSVLNQDVLYGPTIIDHAFVSQAIQIKGFIGSWIAGAIGIQSTKHAWVLVGIVGYLFDLYVLSAYGSEAYGYRIQLAIDALVTMELVAENGPPSLMYDDVDVYGEYDPSYMPFLEAKAPLILRMIERKVEQEVGPRHLQLALQRIVSGQVGGVSGSGGSKQQSSTNNGDDKDDDKDDEDEGMMDGDKDSNGALASGQLQPLSTWYLLRTVKVVAGAPGSDLCKAFLQTWIVRGGLPLISVGFWYNRKQTQAELVLEQSLLPGCEKFEGIMKITIVEDSGEHSDLRRIENLRHKWEFPCHAKVRKKRRTRQKLDQADDDYSQQITGPGMGLNDTPVFWVKIDPDAGWLSHIVMYQPDFNWMEQLLSDSKCVRSRVHAARALALYPLPHEKPHVMACRVLTEAMSGLTTHCNRIRAEAAISLGIWQSLHAPHTNANMALPEWKGMQNLVRIFKEHFFDRTADMPLPNYFLPSGGKVVLESVGADTSNSTTSRDIRIQDYAEGEYEIKKAIPRGLAMVRCRTGFSPPEIETFLLQLLMQNDNSKNYVDMADESCVADDCFYLGSLILSLSVLNLELRSPTSTTAVEITRLLHYDNVKPSYRHTITVCCLEALCNLQLAGRMTDMEAIAYHKYASPAYPSVVRQAAIESILRLYFAEDPRGDPSAQRRDKSRVFGPVAAVSYALKLIQLDESPRIRRFAVQVCLNCIRGFPPSVAAQVLSTRDHAYTLSIMHRIQMEVPGAFIQKSPSKDLIAKAFTPPSLAPLRDDSSAARDVAEAMWSLINTTADYDQPLRVSLSILYRKIWGDTTPICVAHTVQEKSADWAGGFEAFRRLIDVSKNHGAKPTKSSSGYQPKSTDDSSKKRPFMGSPPLSSGLDHLKGKKLKLKFGDNTIASHKL
ncbi:hypothetical protein H310_11824 [Aphanomyces invadans]|uniref:Transcription initiation factor TFIID subunit 2 n=1 Tax=Aphanomyces invadans TaxID=157072 RepID=A0A024TKF7_9STRA|nr:hypothetical protein H310_11824 [Aphanomyces invadans]ETV94518.1 hypothetical protein H310_11824 [Aphanomyces invadans]|eukprot:XP_008876833.1 hypothetical protein H310_11824 [Aphanomyces invadans]